MNFSKVGILIISIIGLYQCTPSKVVSINSELMVIEATKTPQVVSRAPGVRLNFTVISTKKISLDSVYYWEYKHPLTILKANEDTTWVSAEMRNPILGRMMRDEAVDPSTIRPPDSTCILIYHFENKSLKLEIPKLEYIED